MLLGPVNETFDDDSDDEDDERRPRTAQEHRHADDSYADEYRTKVYRG